MEGAQPRGRGDSPVASLLASLRHPACLSLTASVGRLLMSGFLPSCVLHFLFKSLCHWDTTQTLAAGFHIPQVEAKEG